tara:strand:+ start:926 stop:1096 length:171 start_codon:yes stop_codon:yes gene_type:complete
MEPPVGKIRIGGGRWCSISGRFDVNTEIDYTSIEIVCIQAGSTLEPYKTIGKGARK